MASAKSTVTVQILADAKGFKSGMGDAEKASDSLGKKAINVGTVIAAALAVKAVAAVKDFVGDSIKAFSDLEESLNAVDVSYGAAAEGIKNIGKTAATEFGMSNAQFNTFAVGISAFAEQIAGDGGDIIGTVEAIAGRVTDFGSVMNLTSEDAMQKFRSGLAGESEPLRQYGIDVSAAAVEIYALNEGIWDGNDAMTEAEKVQARYGTIMEQTEKVAGDFKNTIDGIANSTKVAGAKLEDYKALAGSAFAPAVSAILQELIPAMQSAAILAIDLYGAFFNLTNLGDPVARTLHAVEAGFLTSQVAGDGLVDSAEEILFALQDIGKGYIRTTEGFNAFLQATKDQNLGVDELNRLIGANDDLLLAYGLTTPQIVIFREEMRKEIVAKTESERWSGLAAHAQGELEAATEGATGATEEAITALEHYEDVVRAQYDPLFALVTAENDLKDATDAVKTAAKEHGEDSPEYVTALQKQATAFMDVRAAQLRVAEQSNLTREEFNTNLVNMGIFTQDQIDLILADFDRVNAFKFTGKTVTINVKGTAVEMGFGMPRITGHEGGIVPGPRGTEVPITALAGEQIIPIDEVGKGRSGGTVINLTVNALDPNTAARAVVEALQSWQRSNGAIPISVRTA